MNVTYNRSEILFTFFCFIYPNTILMTVCLLTKKIKEEKEAFLSIYMRARSYIKALGMSQDPGTVNKCRILMNDEESWPLSQKCGCIGLLWSMLGCWRLCSPVARCISTLTLHSKLLQIQLRWKSEQTTVILRKTEKGERCEILKSFWQTYIYIRILRETH